VPTKKFTNILILSLDIVGKVVSCIDPVGPDPEAWCDNIQQDYVIEDASKQVSDFLENRLHHVLLHLLLSQF
jgi:hypothetical protein